MSTSARIDIEALCERIDSDTPLLVDRIAKALSTDRKEALQVFRELLRFLKLIEISEQRLTPSLRIDLAWHEFILFTRLYTKTCESNFGRYLHHSPGGKEEDNQSQFLQTIQRYETNFGPLPRTLWGLEKTASEAPCGPCES